MNCKDCVYWEVDNAHEEVLGNCDCPKWRKGYSIDLFKPPIGLDEVWVEDDEGWGFMTGPEFCCLHFLEKQDV